MKAYTKIDESKKKTVPMVLLDFPASFWSSGTCGRLVEGCFGKMFGIV